MQEIYAQNEITMLAIKYNFKVTRSCKICEAAKQVLVNQDKTTIAKKYIQLWKMGNWMEIELASEYKFVLENEIAQIWFNDIKGKLIWACKWNRQVQEYRMKCLQVNVDARNPTCMYLRKSLNDSQWHAMEPML